MAADIRYEITSGPSKMDLMLALFDEPVIDGTVRQRTVRFTVEGVTDDRYWHKVGEVEIIIDAVARENGVHGGWNFEGRFAPRPGDSLHVRVKGYYSTHLRKGQYRCIYS